MRPWTFVRSVSRPASKKNAAQRCGAPRACGISARAGGVRLGIASSCQRCIKNMFLSTQSCNLLGTVCTEVLLIKHKTPGDGRECRCKQNTKTQEVGGYEAVVVRFPSPPPGKQNAVQRCGAPRACEISVCAGKTRLGIASFYWRCMHLACQENEGGGIRLSTGRWFQAAGWL
jgi:hypothetical protein